MKSFFQRWGSVGFVFLMGVSVALPGMAEDYSRRRTYSTRYTHVLRNTHAPISVSPTTLPRMKQLSVGAFTVPVPENIELINEQENRWVLGSDMTTIILQKADQACGASEFAQQQCIKRLHEESMAAHQASSERGTFTENRFLFYPQESTLTRANNKRAVFGRWWQSESTQGKFGHITFLLPGELTPYTVIIEEDFEGVFLQRRGGAIDLFIEGLQGINRRAMTSTQPRRTSDVPRQVVVREKPVQQRVLQRTTPLNPGFKTLYAGGVNYQMTLPPVYSIGDDTLTQTGGSLLAASSFGQVRVQPVAPTCTQKEADKRRVCLQTEAKKAAEDRIDAAQTVLVDGESIYLRLENDAPYTSDATVYFYLLNEKTATVISYFLHPTTGQLWEMELIESRFHPTVTRDAITMRRVLTGPRFTE